MIAAILACHDCSPLKGAPLRLVYAEKALLQAGGDTSDLAICHQWASEILRGEREWKTEGAKEPKAPVANQDGLEDAGRQKEQPQ